MPHLIIEYVPTALPNGAVQTLVDAVHRAAGESGLFEPGHIRSRAHAVSHYRCGEDDRPFIHAQLRIKPGRSNAQKQRLSEAVLLAMQGCSRLPVVITAEVVELPVAGYAKLSLS